jgi:hypothetical protein
MSKNSNHTSAGQLTVEAFVNRFSKGPDAIGSGKEIEEYLRVRWRWENKEASWEEVTAAYNKTSLNSLQKQIKT